MKNENIKTATTSLVACNAISDTSIFAKIEESFRGVIACTTQPGIFYFYHWKFQNIFYVVEKMDKWIKLNVGGQQFITSESTLQKEPESMICKIVFGEIPSLKDENGAILIDRSPKYFEMILNYLRMGEIHDKANVEALIEEAKFYGIMSLVEKCQAEYEHNFALIVTFSQFPSSSKMDKSDKLKTIVEELTKFFAQFGNVRGVVLRQQTKGDRYHLLAQVAFAKKEDVFKAQKWCKPIPEENKYSSSPEVILCGMSMQNLRIYDCQLEKYL